MNVNLQNLTSACSCLPKKGKEEKKNYCMQISSPEIISSIDNLSTLV